MPTSTAQPDIVDTYLKWLSNEFETKSSDRGRILMTPFELPDGTGITLELETLPNGNILISDMGDTLGYLFVNGLTLDKSVTDKASFISKRHGVTFKGSFLCVETKPEDAGRAIHELIQTVISVTDLIHLRHTRTTRKIKFDNEVEAFIIRSGVTYDADYQVEGAREKHNFRFYVNSDRNLLIQPLTASTESAALELVEHWAYRFRDTVQSEESWHPVAVLDDSGSPEIWSNLALAPIKQYAIPWSHKDKLAQLLAGSHAVDGA